MATCTLSVICSTDLGYCVVLVDQVVTFLEHVHKTLKDSEKFMSNFPVFFILLVFWLTWQAPQHLEHSHKIVINHRPACFEIGLHDQTSRQFLDSRFCIKDESVYEYYSQTLFANSVHEDCSYIKN